MTESDIYPLIAHLAGGQVYPYVAPLNATGTPSVSPPWVIFSLPTDVSSDVLCGPAESRISVQIDVYSKTIDEARAIREQALELLLPLGLAEISKFPFYEPDTKLHRATLEGQLIA